VEVFLPAGLVGFALLGLVLFGPLSAGSVQNEIIIHFEIFSPDALRCDGRCKPASPKSVKLLLIKPSLAPTTAYHTTRQTRIIHHHHPYYPYSSSFSFLFFRLVTSHCHHPSLPPTVQPLTQTSACCTLRPTFCLPSTWQAKPQKERGPLAPFVVQTHPTRIFDVPVNRAWPSAPVLPGYVERKPSCWSDLLFTSVQL
jgi:hypothetical protein